MNYVVNDAYMSCFGALNKYWTHNFNLKSFWVIGGLKLGFWMKIGLEIVSYNSAQMSTRLSEIPFAQASDSLQRPVWNFGRSLKRATSERNPNFRHLRRLSEIPVA